MNGNYYAEPSTFDAIREMSWQRHKSGEAVQSYGFSTPLLYACIRLQSERHGLVAELDELKSELRQLKDELARANEERDMLRNGHRVLALTMASEKRGAVSASEPRPAARRSRRVCAPDWA